MADHYEPLLWAIESITTCVHHHRRLATVCPGCAKAQPVLAQRSRPGYCSQCEQWLGSPQLSIDDQRPLDSFDWTWDDWVHHAVGDLLATPPDREHIPRREIIATNIGICVTQLTGGNAKSLARHLNLAPATIQHWQQGRKIPRFDTLLRVCFMLNIAPSHMLLQPIQLQPQTLPPIKVAPKGKPLHRRDAGDIELLGKALASIINGNEDQAPSVRTVAKRLGYSISHLYKRFPEECRAISARHKQDQQLRGERYRETVAREVQQATIAIAASGEYPTSRRVAVRLTRPGYMRQPAAMTTWHATLQELGLE